MATDFLKKYKTILEYTNLAGAYNVSEESDDDMQTDPAMGGGEAGAMDPAMGSEAGAMDPAMGGGEAGAMDPAMGSEAGAMDPAMGGGEAGAMDPAMGGGEGGVEGFSPEGADGGPMDGMGADMDNAEGGVPGAEPMQDGDEVIDVDELTKSQESAEKKIDSMNAKFEKLMGAVEVLVKQNAEREKAAAEQERRLAAEIEKRIPTPQQRMTMRSTKSAPYAMTPNEYMNNYAPENYSDADDNNGADDEQYKITKGDIDNFTDYNSIARDLDIEHQGLRDILGF